MTSAVLGTLALPQYHKVLVDLLQDATCPIDGNSGEWLPASSLLRVLDVVFWPRLELDGGIVEPDALVTLGTGSGPKYSVFIEAKHRSGLSGAESQLARQWRAMRANKYPNPRLVYLTTHFTCPREDIADAKKDLEGRGESQHQGRIRWLSWRAVAKHLNSVPSDAASLLLLDVMRKKGLTFFEGWPKIEEPPAVCWKYGTECEEGLTSFGGWPRLEKLREVDWKYRERSEQ